MPNRLFPLPLFETLSGLLHWPRAGLNMQRKDKQLFLYTFTLESVNLFI